MYTRGQLYVFVHGSTFQVQNPSHRNVNGSVMTTTLSMLSPNSIPSPPTCHYAFIPPGIFQRFLNMLLFQANLFFKKICARLKWRSLKLFHSALLLDYAFCLTIYQLISWTRDRSVNKHFAREKQSTRRTCLSATLPVLILNRATGY